MIVLLMGVLSCGAVASESELGYFVGQPVMTFGCFTQAISLESNPIDGIEWPEAEGDPLYGLLRLAENDHPVLIDRRKIETVLLVDSAGNGEFVKRNWFSVLLDGSSVARVPFLLTHAQGQNIPYQARLIWNRNVPAVMTYCRDSYREGEIELGGASYRLSIFDEDTDGRYDDLEDGILLIDADGDRRLLSSSDSHEIFSLNEPFNLGGITYEVAEVSLDGTWIRMAESAISVAPKPPLLASYPAPDFSTTDANGNPFVLSGFQGSIVILDFWASWCAPCIDELPTLQRILDEFPTEKIIVVGVNIDRVEDDFRDAVKDHDIAFLQLYDSDTGPIADLYRIIGVPMTYVIDRDGIIQARGLRKGELITAVRRLIRDEEE